MRRVPTRNERNGDFRLIDMEQDNKMHQNSGAPETTEVIGVRFRETGKVYYFSPEKLEVKAGDHVIVETSRGMEYGEVMTPNKEVPSAELVPPLRSVLRVATPHDVERHEANMALEKNAFDIEAVAVTDSPGSFERR